RSVAFEDERGARAWLHAAARRVASNHRRAEQRRVRRIEQVVRPSTVAAPDEVLDGRRMAARVLDSLERLSPDARSVWRLAALRGLSGPEISERLGIPLNTTYSHLRRARSRLRTLGGAVLALTLLALALLSTTCES